MSEWPSEPNWPAFYLTLQVLGPLMLTGLPGNARDQVVRMSEDSDEFFPSLEEVLYSYWKESPKRAVLSTLETWENNVKVYLDTLIDFGDAAEQRRWRYAFPRVSLKPRRELVAALVIAACGGEVPFDVREDIRYL